MLFQTWSRFFGLGDSAANMAALVTAQACQYALLGYPLAMAKQVAGEATRWHWEATTIATTNRGTVMGKRASAENSE